MTAVNGEMRNLKGEMKLVEAQFRGQADSVEALTKKDEILSKEIEQQEIKIKALEQAVEDASKAYGEADSRTDNYRQSLLIARTELIKLNDALGDNADALRKASDREDKLVKSLVKVKDGAVKAAPVVGKAVKAGATAVVAAGAAAIGALNNIEESTREFRENQAKLQTAFEASGAGADTAREAYAELYKVLGDDGTATEAAQLLAQIADNAKSAGLWTDIAAGAAGVFGDSLPINSMMEFAAETIKTGQITGDLTRMLQYAGIAEEDFQAQLDACGTEQERNRLLTYTLSRAYSDAAEAFKTNSAEAIANRETQLKSNESMAKLGETVAKVKNRLSADFSPALGQVAVAFSKVIDGTEDADEAMQLALENLVQTAANKLPEFFKFSVDVVESIATGLIRSTPSLVEAAPELIDAILDAMLDLGGEFLELGKTLMGYVWQGMISFADKQSRTRADLSASDGRTVAAAALAGSHAGGLNYVPYDGYLAELHKGEAVLTAREAAVMRSLSGSLGSVSRGVTAAELQSVTAAAVNAMAMQGGSSMPQAANIQLKTPDGRTLAEWLIDDLRAVTKSNPEVV